MRGTAQVVAILGRPEGKWLSVKCRWKLSRLLNRVLVMDGDHVVRWCEMRDRLRDFSTTHIPGLIFRHSLIYCHFEWSSQLYLPSQTDARTTQIVAKFLLVHGM